MLIFAQAQYLWLLVLVPLFLIGYGVVRALRRRRIRAFGDPALVGRLMPSWSGTKGWVRMVLFSLAFLFFVIGLARPQIGARLSERKTRGAEVVICLDVSRSMLARDYSPNRLERAKLAIARITDRLQDDRIGLVLFAGTSFVQLPVTTDYVSAKMFLSSIGPESVPVQGTALGEAIRTGARCFSAQSEKSRVLIVISDGENHEDDPVKAAEDAVSLGVRVYTVGVGSREGQPIPVEGGLLRDKDGEIVVTRLDEETLRRVARAGNGAYIHAGNEEFGLNPIINDIRKMEDEAFSNVVFEAFDEQYMYFFALALLLLVIEGLVGERKPRKRLFFILFLLALSLPQPAGAQSLRREMRAGNRSFAREQWAKADIRYRKALLADTTSHAARYNLANTMYRQGDYEAAGNELGKLSGERGSADSYYNLGDVALQRKDYQAAVDAFAQSLFRNPGDLEAKENYIYAKLMLQKQQDGGGAQEQDDQQNQDDQQDQEQNQDQDKNQEPDQPKNQDQNQNQGQAPQMSSQQAQQLLQAIQAKEKETQDKVNKEKAQLQGKRKKEKDW